MSMIEQPNHSIIDKLVERNAMLASMDPSNPSHPGHTVGFIQKPTSSVFPTGQFLGYDVPPTVQNIIQELTTLPIGASAATTLKKPATKAFKSMYKKSQKALREAEKAGEKIHKLWRGVDDWHQGSMVKDGRFISTGKEIAPHFNQGKNVVKPEDLFYTINNPQYASKYGKFYRGRDKMPPTTKGRLLEFHVPESYIKKSDVYDLWGEKLLANLNVHNSPGQYHFLGYDQIAAFNKGLPKDFLQKVYKYGDEVLFRDTYRLPLKGKYSEYIVGK